jgi:hypothetical protein
MVKYSLIAERHRLCFSLRHARLVMCYVLSALQPLTQFAFPLFMRS